ncbi:flagellar biosynthesis protein FlhA [bacterium BMS3Bbin06]|nr:flagellar biosynthesis protein FlhA [bacterium BMS3Abin08]GBE33824.1 flagellar biosynthesis protein FlhA [bacterium BMS3Bbin06]HDO35760.1 flagellar biosynthesis protein FlhA [Nitrospirota bacterium]HDY70573.1 flagellar biosynthesis protein FlhA [Nitrospirota bacterium]
MNWTGLLKQRSDVVLALSMLVVLGVMLLPVPAFALDILLSLSISIAIVILLTSLYIRKPLDFSVFPSLLLMVTLYRLSLNIATTRIILLKGHEGVDAAGRVILSFGNFVVGGNYAVGFVVFLILVIINFVVITKGSGRIAEVAARFTLDAMPGKQMAIDADLNTGLIDEQEARKRRAFIAHEADFYGAMDGSSKFVRGDAIAGLIITAINIIGGLLIGIIQDGMPIAEAARTYTILTIGDGLVSQIPALLISTAAGIVVSRAGSDTDLGEEVKRQIFVNPKALSTTSGVLFILALVPGLPHVPFLLISITAGAVAYLTVKKSREEEEELRPVEAAPEPTIESFLELDPLTLEIGYGLIPLVEEPEGQMLQKIKAMRRQIAQEMGFVVPPIHIKDNLKLRPHEYSFMLKGIDLARSEILLGKWLAVIPDDNIEKVEGIPTREPAFGLPALWIDEKDLDRAQSLGYTVVDTPTVIVTHLTELLRKNGWEVLTRAEVQQILDNVARNYPRIVEELVPAMLPLGTVQRVLQNLLKERVPIKDIITILETLLDHGQTVKDHETLTEFVRQSLARTITRQHLLPDGTLPVFTLDPIFEKEMVQSLGEGAGVSPQLMQRLMKSLDRATKDERVKSIQPILVCSPQVRKHLRKITERIMPSLVVLSSGEISPEVKLYSLGMVSYEN